MLLRLEDLKKCPALMASLEPQFWRDVSKKGECWFWCGETTRNGYGEFVYKVCRRLTIVVSAHRLAYLLQQRVDPGDLFVRRTCREKRCVRGEHLYLEMPVRKMRKHSRMEGTKSPEIGVI